MKKAILADKQYSKAYYLLGTVFLNELDNKNAEKNLESSIKYFEKNPKAHFKLGEMYYLEKDFTNSEKNLKVSLSFEDENAEAHHYLANIYREDKDPNQAKKHYYRALEINPDFALAYFRIWVITAWKLAILMRLKFIIKKPLILIKTMQPLIFN